MEPIKLSKVAKVQYAVKLLESITGKKVTLRESDEATKNLTVEALQNISETLDTLKMHLTMAYDKVRTLPSQDAAVQKLRGMESIVDTSITDIAEMIADITAMPTSEDSLQEGLDDEKGVEMSTDDALQNIDNVKKFAEKGLNVVLNEKVSDSLIISNRQESPGDFYFKYLKNKF